MKLSKPLHVLSVVFGIAGLVLWTIAIFASPAFGQPQNIMLLCGVLSFLAAIWLNLAAIYHTMQERS